MTENMPVLVGVGQVTEKTVSLDGSSPLDLMEQAVYLAVQDAGIKKSDLADLDSLVVVKSFREPTHNSAETLATRIGAGRATQWMMPNGGNGPQYLVNRYCEAIAKGESEFVLFTGSEAMATARKIVKETGAQPDWQEAATGDPQYLVPDVELSTDHEKKHGVWMAPGFYAMAENARRHQQGHSIEDHQIGLGKLFSKFTDVAAKSPHAWYPISRSAEEIAHPSEANRTVAWPYTKYMNAMNQINQSAAILLTSEAHARKLGISEDRFVYLHGCADTSEKEVLKRGPYYMSPAIKMMADQVFEGDQLSIEDIDYIDFYSCFPSAVAMARDAFGISPDDPRDFTVTGGLPFHGGAGNNYVMNSIAAMVEKVRADRGKYGLVTANGGYFSKHAAGIYSTVRAAEPWQRVDPATYQKTLNDVPDVVVNESPSGRGTIETYTVLYGRSKQPEQGIVIGRLGELDDASAERFVAVVKNEGDTLVDMTRRDMVGEKGELSQDGELNVFTPG